MTDAEVFAFSDVFKGLERVFPKRLEEHERAHLHREYFKAMRRFPLNQVQAGAEAWVSRGKYFPKPAEWIDAIPKASAQATVDLPALNESEARAYEQAERMRYEGRCCSCRECVEADVTEKPTRFVPEFDAEDREVRVRCGERIVVAGHWAHGQELARWYQARGDFYAKFVERFGMRPEIGA